MSAVQDLGTGTKTMLAVVVAEELGVPPANVVIRIGDTRFPIGPDSGGSVTTGSISPAVRNAAWQAKQKLFAAVAPKFGTTADNLAMQKGRVVFKNDASKSYTLKQIAAKLPTGDVSARATRVPEYSKERLTYGGVDYVELAVDTETGRVHVEKVFGAHDCGRPINPTGVISQINGGILQGISYALFEQRIMDRNAGYMLNANLENYKILGAREVPEIEVVLVENYIAQSSTDAAGIGESAGIITLAAAIGNAFYNATGVRMRKIPMTPANVLAALGKTQEEVAGMNKFAFVDTRTVDEALSQLGDGAVVKAGGIDLLDLMKEDIVSPPKLVNIRNIDSLRGITAATGWPAAGAAVDLERDRGSSGNPTKVCSAVGCRRSRGHTASAEHGDAGRQPHAAAALLVLPLQRLRLQEEGRHQQRVPCSQWGEPIPRHHQQRHLRHGAPLLDGRAAFGHGRASGAHVEAGQAYGRHERVLCSTGREPGQRDGGADG